jgi:hypothetical protein
VDKIDASMNQAFQTMDALPWGVYSALAGIYDGRPELLRSEAFLEGHVQRAYFEYVGLESVRGGVWRLTRGSIVDHVRRLKSGALVPEDANDQKLATLLQEGFLEEADAVRTCDLLSNVPFTTKIGEQGHASATELEAEHPGYGEVMAMCRAGLHAVRALFRSPREGGPEYMERKKLGTQIRIFQKKNPNKTGKEQEFLSELCATRRRETGARALSWEERKSAFGEYQELFKTRSESERKGYRAAGRSSAKTKKRKQMNDLEEKTAKATRLDDAKKEKRREAEREMLPIAVGNSRWGEEDVADVAMRWRRGHVDKETLNKARVILG